MIIFTKPDQGHLRLPPYPRNEVMRFPSPNVPKHRWIENVIHNVWRHNLQ